MALSNHETTQRHGLGETAPGDLLEQDAGRADSACEGRRRSDADSEDDDVVEIGPSGVVEGPAAGDQPQLATRGGSVHLVGGEVGFGYWPTSTTRKSICCPSDIPTEMRSPGSNSSSR